MSQANTTKRRIVVPMMVEIETYTADDGKETVGTVCMPDHDKAQRALERYKAGRMSFDD